MQTTKIKTLCFTNSQHMTGVGFMLISSMSVALSALFGKQLTSSLNLDTIVLLRFLIPALILWGITLLTMSFNKIRIVDLKTHLIRAIFVVLSQYSFLYYLTQGTMLDATLLFMTSPLFVPLISKVTQKTSIKHKVWISIIVGFIGIGFILKPTEGIIEWPALIGLASGFFNACSQVAFHKLSRKTNANNIMLFMYTFSFIITSLMLLIFWHDFPSNNWLIDIKSATNNWPIVLGLALAGIASQTLRSKAYSKVKKAMSLSPFLYAAILFSGLLDWLVFSKVPDLWSCLGAGFIVISALIMLLKINVPEKIICQNKLNYSSIQRK